MEREKKTVSLAIVTLLMYGLVSVLGGGPFAFFPANELAFFIVTLYFAFYNFKISPVSYCVLLLLAMLGLADSQIFLSFFLDNQKLEIYFQSVAINYVRLGIYVLMLFEMIRFFHLTKWKFYAFLLPVIAGVLICGVWFGSLLLVATAIVFFTTLLYFSFKNSNSANLYAKSLFYLWIFLGFLKLSMLLTMTLYNFKIV